MQRLQGIETPIHSGTGHSGVPHSRPPIVHYLEPTGERLEAEDCQQLQRGVIQAWAAIGRGR